VDGLILLIRRKAAKRNAEAVVEDSVLELMTKELFALVITKVNVNAMFEQYVIADTGRKHISVIV